MKSPILNYSEFILKFSADNILGFINFNHNLCNLIDDSIFIKCQEFELISARLALMPSHDSLYLLRHVIAMPRLLYTLRTAPCMNSQELLNYDNLVRDTCSRTLNIDINDNRWKQLSLPVRWGGLGIRSAVMLAPSAYLTSAASTAVLTRSLLPDRLHDIEHPGTTSAMTTWSVISGHTEAPMLASSQRAWDDLCCKSVADELLEQVTSESDRARLLASRAEGSGDWLDALPLQSVGLKLDNESVRVAAGLRTRRCIGPPAQMCL